MKRLVLFAMALVAVCIMPSCEKDPKPGDIGNTVTGTLNGHDYVDLGLPSGILWATCNLGAEKPEDYGNYYAWGETQPKDYYYWSTYKYCSGVFALIKYCCDSVYGYNGYTDNLTVLLPEDDAAKVNWGNGWRMPTKEELQELNNNTTSIWTTLSGVNGRLFTASNGNSLFLPAAGSRWANEFDDAGCHGFFLSSSLDMRDPSCAWYFYFNSNYHAVDGRYRVGGYTVRPVCSAE